MRRASHPEQRKAIGHCAIRRRRERASDLDTSDRHAVDDRASCQSAGGSEEIWWLEDLCVVVVGRAGATETSAAVDDGGVGEEEGC